jgi:hypothetical protein
MLVDIIFQPDIKILALQKTNILDSDYYVNNNHNRKIWCCGALSRQAFSEVVKVGKA